MQTLFKEINSNCVTGFLCQQHLSKKLWLDFSVYQVAQKVSHWKKGNSSAADTNFLTKISGFTTEGDVNYPWKYHWNIFVASRITAFTIFYSIFQSYTKVVDSPCNVQRR